MRLDIHRPRPEPPTTMTRSASEFILSVIGRTSPVPTSSLQSIPVELRELSKHPTLVLVLDTHSGIYHIHSEEADGVHPNLISGIVRHDIIGASSYFGIERFRPYTRDDAVFVRRAEKLRGTLDVHRPVSWCELNLVTLRSILLLDHCGNLACLPHLRRGCGQLD